MRYIYLLLGSGNIRGVKIAKLNLGTWNFPAGFKRSSIKLDFSTSTGPVLSVKLSKHFLFSFLFGKVRVGPCTVEHPLEMSNFGLFENKNNFPPSPATS